METIIQSIKDFWAIALVVITIGSGVKLFIWFRDYRLKVIATASFSHKVIPGGGAHGRADGVIKVTKYAGSNLPLSAIVVEEKELWIRRVQGYPKDNKTGFQKRIGLTGVSIGPHNLFEVDLCIKGLTGRKIDVSILKNEGEHVILISTYE